jgi:hypothetical protein
MRKPSDSPIGVFNKRLVDQDDGIPQALATMQAALGDKLDTLLAAVDANQDNPDALIEAKATIEHFIRQQMSLLCYGYENNFMSGEQKESYKKLLTDFKVYADKIRAHKIKLPCEVPKQMKELLGE